MDNLPVISAASKGPHRLTLLPTGERGVYRLWLFPANRFEGGILLPAPPFDKLLKQFRSADVRFSSKFPAITALCISRPASISFIDYTEADLRDYRWMGLTTLFHSEAEGRQRYGLHLSDDDLKSEWFRAFHPLARIGGSHLPVSVQDELDWCKPTNSFAWWMTFLWRYAHQEQSAMQGGEWVSHPFRLSANAILRCEAINLEGGILGEGDWSGPLSKAEIAERLTGKKKAKARDIPRSFTEKYGHLIQAHSAYKVRIRLDLLPPELRDKLK